jgi:hypothetical protein
MVDVVELRNAAAILRQWASEIRRDSVPAPYATAGEDISLLEKVSRPTMNAITKAPAI